MTTTADRLARLVAPVADELAVAVYDIEDVSGTLRVLLDRPGGVDVDTLSDASRRISRSMDEDGSFASASLLEVSSPGLERKLRTPEHLQGAVGEQVKVKLRPGVDGDRRLEGTLSAADDHAITVTPEGGEPRTVPIDDITSARTVFVWEAAPKPGKGAQAAKGAKGQRGARGAAVTAPTTTDTDEPDLDEEAEGTP
ncbi:ribosome maturation factor RimP [Dermatobacter hominis]|uniref:ribosome maturation factor RimP n=1 Tax=Dermatobacter hominis TaxID=2884263 RepID=UPI001D10E2E1|nr:ribosome maturation factor RimP [Dermatobacter hominis]UDY36854.1 ribosome maturation factor RimP [Dermatobacter hominis]